MKCQYYDYLENNFQNSSNIIRMWAIKNNVHMFDFDECMFDIKSQTYLLSHLKWVKENFSILCIVECHPYFNTYEDYNIKKSQVVTIAEDLNIPYFFLTSDYNYWLQPEKTFNKSFFPDWYFRLRRWAVNNNYEQHNFKEKKNYNFSCGNKFNLRSEKIYNYIECYKRKRADWLITIYDHNNFKISTVRGKNFSGLNDEQIKLWDNEIRQTIKNFKYDLEPPDDKLNPISPHAVMFPVHTDSYCNLVMEHSMEIEILSEKSYKPFVAEQIPIYLAGLKAAKALTYLGFDLFYDFIDHDLYDYLHTDNSRNPDNFTKRIDKVHELIDQLYTTNFQDFFYDSNTKTRIKQNKDYFYSDEIDKLCIRHLDQFLINN